MARRSSQKRRVDPKAPKKNKIPWQMFSSDNREEVTKQNPNLRYREITKKLGEMWRQSDENVKRRYQKQYQTEQAEYDEKLAAYKNEKNKKRQSSNSKKNDVQTKKGNNNNEQSNEDSDEM